MNLIQFLEPKKRVLDFSECRYWDEVHQLIQDELELPEWYGQNLDALWDSINGIMYLPADVTIIYKPKAKKPEEWKDAIGEIIEVFKEAEQKYHFITVTVEM